MRAATLKGATEIVIQVADLPVASQGWNEHGESGVCNPGPRGPSAKPNQPSPEGLGIQKAAGRAPEVRHHTFCLFIRTGATCPGVPGVGSVSGGTPAFRFGYAQAALDKRLSVVDALH